MWFGVLSFVSSDSTAAMAGKHSRLVIKINELAPPECKLTHYFLHQEV